MAMIDDEVYALLANQRRWHSEGEIVSELGLDHTEVAEALARLEAAGRASQARPLTEYDTPLWGMRGKP